LLVLRGKLDDLKYDKNYKNLSLIINDLSSLTHESLYNIWLNKELSISSQQIIELRERKTFKPSITTDELPNYVQTLLHSNRPFVETNEKREFVEGSNIKRVMYSSYFPVNSSTVSALKNKS
jgi:hypothetical protein